ncbi:hypothetical protein [Nitrososphaera sp. AFS]|uniref:hypothetical protein n=1 Tax=Nitrososphaera sp. AFS TaxID=2301191 RepID=UPI0013921F34|nr:hypothetical protein [Nitrososphaera sp. AFS]
MEQRNYNSNTFYRQITANSLFTSRQIDIISKRLASERTIENISSGAYYRQVKQCKIKITRLLYSIILLYSISALDEEAFHILERLASQLNVILYKETGNNDNPRAQNVMSVIDQLIKRMSKV